MDTREIQERLAQRQEEDNRLRRQKIRDLTVKSERCISEISWRFFPSGGFRNIDIDAAEQTIRELFEALRELQRIDKREQAGGDHGPTF